MTEISKNIHFGLKYLLFEFISNIFMSAYVEI